MRVLTQLGEASALVGGKDYLVRPSFAALAQIGSPEELDVSISLVCEAYSAYRAGATPTVTRIAACSNVLSACSDFPDNFMGNSVESKTGKLMWAQGVIPVHDLIIMAHHCIKWGVAGDSKFKNKPKKPSKPSLFDPAEFVAVLVDEFNMGRSDAWNCTMTEFQRLCEQRQRKAWGDKPEPPTKESAAKSFAYAQEAIARARKLGIKPNKTEKRGR